MMKILKVLQFDIKSSIGFYSIILLGIRFTATIRIALENRCVVDSRVCSVTFKTLTSIIFQTEYSVAFLLYMLSSTRSNSIAKERKIRLKYFEGRPFHFQIFDHLE